MGQVTGFHVTSLPLALLPLFEVLQPKRAPKSTTRGTDSRTLLCHHRAVTSVEEELRQGRTAPMAFVVDGDTVRLGETDREGEKCGMPCVISGQLR